jgi:hypothetical protein
MIVQAERPVEQPAENVARPVAVLLV